MIDDIVNIATASSFSHVFHSLLFGLTLMHLQLKTHLYFKSTNNLKLPLLINPAVKFVYFRNIVTSHSDTLGLASGGFHLQQFLMKNTSKISTDFKKRYWEQVPRSKPFKRTCLTV